MDTSFKDSLSTRSRNGLIGRFGYSDIIYQPEKIAAGRDKLKLARNIGPKSLREIAEALYKLGYIEDIEYWIRS